MGTATSPVFSVVMPVWNRAAWLGGAIASVLAQTFGDFELLVVDDGSSDAIAEAVAPFLADARVRLLRDGHHGVCAARNRGLANASARYVAYLDSDNRWRPRFLERMHGTLESKGAMVAYSDYYLWRRRRLTGRRYLARVCSPQFDFRRLLRANSIDINTLVHDRGAVAECGGWDEGIERMNDWDFILRLTSRYEPVHVAEALVDYQMGMCDDTITRTRKAAPSGLAVTFKSSHFRRATITHDTITYTWDRLPYVKYYNWVKFSQHAVNTRDFRAACLPSMLQIEPTNLCNLACPLCPAGRGELGRPRRSMTFGEFKGIVDDLQDYLMLLVLWDWGEPFINRELPEMVAYASAHDIRTVTSTNAHFLNDDAYLERLLRAGLSTLIVAIDSLCDESYQVYRKRGTLNRALDGLHNLIAIKRRLGAATTINMRMVVMRHNEHEVGALEQAAREAGADCFTVKTVNPSCGSHADESLVPESPKYRRFAYRPGTWERIPADTRCDRVWMMTNVLSDGSVVPCCYDYDGGMKVGNAFATPISELWNSPEYCDLRRKVLLEKASFTRCRECHTSFKEIRGRDWFVDRVDFNMPLASTAQYKLRKLLRHDLTYRAWRLVHNYLRPLAR